MRMLAWSLNILGAILLVVKNMSMILRVIFLNSWADVKRNQQMYVTSIMDKEESKFSDTEKTDCTDSHGKKTCKNPCFTVPSV